jgi:uncharacterized protein (DUF779 family)
MVNVAEGVVATDAALAAIECLTAMHGRLMFYESEGCCDGSSPMCFRAGELLLGPGDLLLGEVGGAPFYIDAGQYERWGRPTLLLDVASGPAPGFSLEAPGGLHFVTRTPQNSQSGASRACTPQPPKSSETATTRSLSPSSRGR